MIITFTPKFQKKLKKIKKADPVLFKRVTKQLNLLQKKADHPSLRLHKLSNSQENAWSISINMSLRMLFYFSEDTKEEKTVFFAIGTHEEVYD